MRSSLDLAFRRPLLLPLLCLGSTAAPSFGTCAAEPPSPDCGLDRQFPGGRWDIFQVTGIHTTLAWTREVQE